MTWSEINPNIKMNFIETNNPNPQLGKNLVKLANYYNLYPLKSCFAHQE